MGWELKITLKCLGLGGGQRVNRSKTLKLESQLSHLKSSTISYGNRTHLNQIVLVYSHD